MAMHVRTSTGWKTINWDAYNAFTGPGSPLYVYSTELYAPGEYAPAQNAKIYNAGAWRGFLDNVTCDTISVFGNPNYAEVQFGSDGIIYKNPGSPVTEPWCQNGTNTYQYEIFAQQVSGLSSVIGSSMSTWLNLGISREFYINSPMGGSAVIQITIRHKDTLQQLTTATVSLSMSESEEFFE